MTAGVAIGGPVRAAAPPWLWPWAAFLFMVPYEALLNVADLATPFHLLGVGAALLLALVRPGRIAAAATLAVASNGMAKTGFV